MWLRHGGQLVALSLLVAGCTVGLRTATERDAGDPCGMEVFGGYLVAESRSGLGLRIGGLTHSVVWPFGYTARRDLYLFGPLVLVDRQGRAIAREGDLVALRGGFDRDEVAHLCQDPDLEIVG